MCNRLGLNISKSKIEKCFIIPKSTKIIRDLNKIHYQELIVYENKYKNDILAKNKLLMKKNYYLVKDIYNNLKINNELWDIIILSGHGKKKYLNEIFSEAITIQTAGMYIIKNHYYKILLNNFREAVKKMEYLRKNNLDINYIKNGIDQNWKKLQKEDKWYIFNNNLAYQEPDFSDIENIYVDYMYCIV